VASFNHLTVAGNLTRDPEIRYINDGTAVCSCAIAVNRKFKEREEVLFLDVVVWSKSGENFNLYCRKGDPVLLHGRLAVRPYETKDGEKRKAVEIVVTEWQMLGGKRENQEDGGSSREQAYNRGSSREDAGMQHLSGNNYDDEIPF
jgi:single-strand DNA-binding protein